MNYRHAFHAGGLSDVFKHAVLTLLLERLVEKGKPCCYIDTHAGIGRYDLTASEAARTGEYRAGIAPLLEAPPAPALARYLDIVRAAQPGPAALAVYPGSPALAQALLRPEDRLVLIELHPEDVATLRRTLRGDRRVHVHHRDAYEGLVALLPPPERRGLVLIDPPFEERDELPALVDALAAAHARWPTGQYAVWYPVKARGPVDRFHAALAGSGLRKLLAAEFLPTPDQPLQGSGLILVNPPWRLEEQLIAVLDALAAGVGRPEAGRRVDWLVPE